jgi:hypothetical protein
MTATIQKEIDQVQVKDLYFTNPVEVQEWNEELKMIVNYTIEEERAIRFNRVWGQRIKRRDYKYWFDTYKREFRCVVCKKDNPIIFHHLDPQKKRYSISTMISQCMRLRDIQAELKKCVAVCPSCHMEIEDNSISYDDLLKKAREEYSKYYRPGECILENFPQDMLVPVELTIVSKYDENYLRKIRVLHNFKEHIDGGLEKHPDYIDFCKKYIVTRNSEVDDELYEDDELGEFEHGYLDGEYTIMQ